MGGDSFAIISLTPSGDERWIYIPTWDGYNGVWSIATDSNANVYASGWIGTELPYHPYFVMDLAVVSVSPAGTERWRFTYPGTDPLTGISDQVVVGPKNRVYAVGFSRDIDWGPELTVVSLSAEPRHYVPLE